MIAGCSTEVRHDVNGLQDNLEQLSSGFKKFMMHHRTITGKMQDLISQQNSLQKRLQEAGRQLQNCKSMLARRKS